MPLRERLLQIARAFFAMISAPEAIAGHRILCTPQMADSQLPQMFWEAGPKRVQEAFADLLRGAVAAGELEIDDIPRGVSQFFACSRASRMRAGVWLLRGSAAANRAAPGRDRRHVPARLRAARTSGSARLRAY